MERDEREKGSLVFTFVLFLRARVIFTDAKHRVQATSWTRVASNALWRGARGSNPSQKTPRQRGAIAPSTHFARSARCVASYSKAQAFGLRKLIRNTVERL